MQTFLLNEEGLAIVCRLASAFKTAPCYIADAFGVSPERIERLMYMRGQFEPFGQVALIDAIRTHYGQHAADLCIESWKEGD